METVKNYFEIEEFTYDVVENCEDIFAKISVNFEGKDYYTIVYLNDNYQIEEMPENTLTVGIAAKVGLVNEDIVVDEFNEDDLLNSEHLKAEYATQVYHILK